MTHFKNIALIIAGSLLLLHSLIPHEHHSELDEIAHIEQHQEADDLFDFLKLVFHLDFGGEHLENFKTANYFYITPDLFDAEIFAPTYQLTAPQLPSGEIQTYTAVHEIQQLTFRGPPMQG